MLSIVKDVFDAIDPRIRHNILIKKMTAKEAEIELLPTLCRKNEIAVDVGANRGLYVHHLIPIAKQVYGFEPLPDMQAYLTKMYGGKFTLQPVALSDAEGQVEIRLPAGNPSWATIATTNKLELAPSNAGIVSHLVAMRRLDDYDFKGVGLVKIDVEGNEEAVLRGAVETLKREAPSVIVEVEERHNAGSVRRVEAFMAGLGYAGFHYADGHLRPMSGFDLARDQPEGNVTLQGKVGRYINNFVYVHASKQDRIQHLVA